jgi:cell division transport system ATP-binding protein
MIRFTSVTKKYAGATRPALNGVDFEILRGEFVFLVGASGSGKSSCLRLMIKEDRPNSGSIHVLGQDLGNISSRKVPYFRRNLGVVFQDFRLLPNKTVFENVAFTLQVIGKSRGFIQEAVPDVLQMVGLAGKAQRYPHELSGGEQQRVAIARAIVNKPSLLLADEPTGNLDPATSAGIMALLERINAGGTTIVMATHAADFVDRMQKRVIELAAGQIVRDERESGYGQTAALPVVGASTVINNSGDLTAIAAAAMAATEMPTSGEMPAAAEPAVTGPAEVAADDSAAELDQLFAMNDSQPVAPATAGLPLAERLRLQAQARGTEPGAQASDEQNVGPVS